MIVVEDGVQVELEDIGEGWSGDYQPDDPDDDPLLRFTVSLVKPRDDDPDFPHDASYSTRLVASLPDEDQRRICEAIMRRVKDSVLAGASIKRTCEELSWLGSDDVERLRAKATAA